MNPSNPDTSKAAREANVKAQVIDQLRDALSEAENDNFHAAAMWANLAAEQWGDFIKEPKNA